MKEIVKAKPQEVNVFIETDDDGGQDFAGIGIKLNCR